MKRVYLSILCALAVLPMWAQTSTEKGHSIALKVVVEDMVEPFPAAAKQQMANKLNILLTQNGISSLEAEPQFVITAFATPQTKDVIAGPPMLIAENMEISFYIADVVREIVFATTSITTKGVGEGDAKAYMDAIKKINLNSAALKSFVAEGKAKVIAYYDEQAPIIIEKARTLSAMKSYEEALWILNGIPSECRYYSESLTAMKEVYVAYQNQLCVENLALARTTWAAEQNATGAAKAGEYLAQIYPDAACYGEAMELYAEIKGKVLDDWKFEMKQYQDQVDLEQQRIEAARAVGVAYGNHQQPTTTNIGFLR